MITPWLITGVTVIVVYVLDRLETRWLKKIFDWIPAILLAYLIPAAISYLGELDLTQDSIHDFSRHYFIPLAIVSVMSSLSLRQLKAIGWKPILVFIAGSLFIALFPVLVALTFQDSQLVSGTLIQDGFWKGIPPVVGSWIGGSTSQLVLKELVSCPENIFLTVLVMDNILVNLWTILMFQGIKRSKVLNKVLKVKDDSLPFEVNRQRSKPYSILLCALVFIGIVLLSNALIRSFIGQIIFLSLMGLVLSNTLKRWNIGFALKAGGILILIVMAVLGLKLQFATLGINTEFLSLMIIWLLGHFVFMVIVAKLLNVNMAWVPIASMANVGGIATAPAVTAAYEKRWMPHAVILAILSMATGTFWGILTIALFENLIR